MEGHRFCVTRQPKVLQALFIDHEVQVTGLLRLDHAVSSYLATVVIVQHAQRESDPRQVEVVQGRGHLFALGDLVSIEKLPVLQGDSLVLKHGVLR